MFYQRYEELCKKHGKKPYSVAKELGFGNSNVAVWKSGSTPRPAGLRKIAEYFDVPISYFLVEIEDEKSPPPKEGEQVPEFNLLTPENQEFVRKQIAFLLDQQRGG